MHDRHAGDGSEERATKGFDRHESSPIARGGSFAATRHDGVLERGKCRPEPMVPLDACDHRKNTPVTLAGGGSLVCTRVKA